jgi:hypothetical protein
MKKNTTKKSIIVLSGMAIFLVLFMLLVIVNPGNIGARFWGKTADQNQIAINIGDVFSGFDLITYNGTTVQELPVGKVTVVTYLSEKTYCCDDIIKDFNHFCDVCGNATNQSVIWIEDIPKSLIEKYQIKSDVNYSLYEKRLFTLRCVLKDSRRGNGVIRKGYTVFPCFKPHLQGFCSFHSLLQSVPFHRELLLSRPHGSELQSEHAFFRLYLSRC